MAAPSKEQILREIRRGGWRNAGVDPLEAEAGVHGGREGGPGPVVRDTEGSRSRDAIAAAAARNDLIVSTGRVSAGEEDHVRAAVEVVGGLDFWRLPVKPWKSIAVGQACGVLFVGLPGNPAAASSCGAGFARSPDGTTRAELFPASGSGLVRSPVWADGLVEILEQHGDVGVGDVVRYVPYSVLDH